MRDAILVLASSSPRRRQILEQLGIAFVPRAADIDESALAGETAVALTVRLASQKAAAAVDKAAFVLGADTVVVLDDEVLTKPRDAQEAEGMLKALQGRWHTAVTGVAVAAPGAVAVPGAEERETRCGETRCVQTRVLFRTLSESEIKRYVATGEGADKAGAYGIQALGAGLVREIRGSFTNVVGLPAAETVELLLHVGALSAWPVPPSPVPPSPVPPS